MMDPVGAWEQKIPWLEDAVVEEMDRLIERDYYQCAMQARWEWDAVTAERTRFFRRGTSSSCAEGYILSPAEGSEMICWYPRL